MTVAYADAVEGSELPGVGSVGRFAIGLVPIYFAGLNGLAVGLPPWSHGAVSLCRLPLVGRQKSLKRFELA